MAVILFYTAETGMHLFFLLLPFLMIIFQSQVVANPLEEQTSPAGISMGSKAYVHLMFSL